MKSQCGDERGWIYVLVIGGVKCGLEHESVRVEWESAQRLDMPK